MEQNKMYSLATKPDVDKIFSKLKKKNPKQLQTIFKKIEQIVENPYHLFDHLLVNLWSTYWKEQPQFRKCHATTFPYVPEGLIYSEFLSPNPFPILNGLPVGVEVVLRQCSI